MSKLIGMFPDLINHMLVENAISINEKKVLIE